MVFSGGECFLLGDDLTSAVQKASDKGFIVRAVTNGFWARNLDTGRRVLGSLVRAGLSEINISTGDQHVRFVSLETVVNATVLAAEFQLKIALVIELHQQSRITSQTLLSYPEIENLVNESTKFKIIESPWMPTQLDRDLQQHESKMINRENVHLRGGCEDVLQTLVLTPAGKIGHCCGLPREQVPELNSENIDIENDLWRLVNEVGTDFFKMWLFVDGPENILAWAATKNSKIRWENRYSHRCHACLAVFNDRHVRETISKHYTERIDDVVLRYSILVKRRKTLENYMMQELNNTSGYRA